MYKIDKVTLYGHIPKTGTWNITIQKHMVSFSTYWFVA